MGKLCTAPYPDANSFCPFRVFQQIPLYISQIKVLFLNILGLNGADGISSVSGYADTLNDIYGKTVDWSNTSTAVTTLNSFTVDQWTKLKEAFPAFSDMITQNLDKINHMNTFLGVNMSQNPGFGFQIAFLIPVLAGVTQFISVKVSQAGMSQPDSDNPAAASMKMMTYFMPLMSAFLAIVFLQVLVFTGLQLLLFRQFRLSSLISITISLEQIKSLRRMLKSVIRREPRRDFQRKLSLKVLL